MMEAPKAAAAALEFADRAALDLIDEIGLGNSPDIQWLLTVQGKINFGKMAGR